jgi:hypothetical protein
MAPTSSTAVSKVSSGSRTFGSSKTQVPSPVHAIITCATMTPATSSTLRLSA